MKKKIIAFVLSLAMAVALAPAVTTSAYTTIPYEFAGYNYDSDTVDNFDYSTTTVKIKDVSVERGYDYFLNYTMYIPKTAIKQHEKSYIGMGIEVTLKDKNDQELGVNFASWQLSQTGKTAYDGGIVETLDPSDTNDVLEAEEEDESDDEDEDEDEIVEVDPERGMFAAADVMEISVVGKYIKVAVEGMPMGVFKNDGKTLDMSTLPASGIKADIEMEICGWAKKDSGEIYIESMSISADGGAANNVTLKGSAKYGKNASVKASFKELSSIVLDKKTKKISLKKGEKIALVNANVPGISVKVNSSKIAKYVAKTGEIKGVKAGSTKVTVKYGTEKKTINIVVTK